ncbi:MULTISPECIES: hypothetical protein [unclassified Desulfovibrio]|uniref:hypothetical protein n=1 Tax=unclassified Desulfovibrio TaxID=2593640 RepID=UPI0013ED9259|nr:MULTISPECIES: hypothetical protein [unclassified Desulfovibrio]
MQVSGSYSPIGAVNGIDRTQRTRREPRRSEERSGDTVSISDEAKAAFRIALGKNGDDLASEGAETAAKFRQALEDAWNENGSGASSLMGQLRGLWNKFLD